MWAQPLCTQPNRIQRAHFRLGWFGISLGPQRFEIGPQGFLGTNMLV